MSDSKITAEMLRNQLNCDPSDLLRKVTVAEAEEAHMVTIRESGQEVPFGYVHSQWKRLLSRMQEGDELWEFNSDEQSWKLLAGRAGVALLRDGKIIAEIVTSMN